MKPPGGTEEIRVVELVNDMLQQFSRESKNEEEQLSLWYYIKKRAGVVYSFHKETKIKITTVPASRETDTILYSMGPNQLKVVKPLYITYIQKMLCYSFDNKVWFSTRNNKEEGVRGIANNFDFENDISNNEFSVKVAYSCKKGNNPDIIELKKERDVIQLEKGMTFSSKVKITRITDLNKKILYIPSDTVLTGVLNLNGNMIRGETKNGYIQLQSLTDIFVFMKKKLFSLSFDGKNWNENVLCFELDPQIEITATGENYILIDYSIFLDYRKDRMSLSVINLFL